MSGTTEFSFRLAGSMATPCFMNRTMLPPMGRPLTRMVPPPAGRAPNMVCISSLAPQPARPVKATISPRFTVRSTPEKPWPV